MAATGSNVRNQYLVVINPMANIRKEPVDAPPAYIHDNLQETQVLYNEVLVQRGENRGWYRVEAPEQRDFTRDRLWQGYSGWIRKQDVLPVDALPTNNVVVVAGTARVLEKPSFGAGSMITLSIGTRLKDTGVQQGSCCRVDLPDGRAGWVRKKSVRTIGRRVREDRIRQNIVRTASLFLNVPYLWGGRSMHMPEPAADCRQPGGSGDQRRTAGSSTPGCAVTGVDCSGLTNLVYRANNIDIPRNAHAQWMMAQKIPPDRMRDGDLIFVSAQGDFHSINHVMIYTGGDTFVEALETGSFVRTTTFRERFGKTLSELVAQDLIIENKKIYCGKANFSP
ncbi:NlpC/P60 family protein [Syntrophorhabdus aromaticivorans]|uniref:C40 family peptidase n=1 Tax=Syntrophorhabdus aromaticivorans TaxID=328301 RepID=A0A971M5D0_9BACT|nr:NlpC/P60 family protein [Syntrophorhabdus aromaticivorans]NLW35441.1 C40 family peptidase [Syntrophorhabdus aromaticivorans]